MPKIRQRDRQESLNRAMQLFWQQGYHATSLKHIEQALELHPGSIYAAFGSKAALFREALDYYGCALSEEMQQCIARATSPLEGIRAYLREVGKACTAPAREGVRPVRACMVVKTILETSELDRDIAQHANRLLTRVEEYFEEVLRQAQKSGEIRDDVDPRRLARFLQAQLMGLRAFAQRDVSRRVVRDLTADIIDSLDAYT